MATQAHTTLARALSTAHDDAPDCVMTAFPVPPPSRRTLLGALALSAAPLASAAAPLRHPDADLLRLGEVEPDLRRRAIQMDEQASTAWRPGRGYTDRERARDAAYDEHEVVLEAIHSTRAKTLRGLAVKVQALAWFYEPRGGETGVDALTRAVLAEIVSLAERTRQ